MSGSCHAGTRCTNTGAAGSFSSAASSGSAARAAYASSTKRHVVSMPFQSSRSLKAARPLTKSATQKSPNQNQPVPQRQVPNASTTVSASAGGARRRKFQDRLAFADHAHLFPRELLDVERIVAQPLNRLGEVGLPPAQRRQLALDRAHVMH